MKVRASHFAQDIAKVNWKGIPEDMKKDGLEIRDKAAQFYSEGGDIAKGIDAYVAALNLQLQKAEAAENKTDQIKIETAPGKSISAIRVLGHPNYDVLVNKKGQSIIVLSKNYDNKGNYSGPNAILSETNEAFHALGYEPTNPLDKITRKEYLKKLKSFEKAISYNKTEKKTTGSKSGRTQGKAESDKAKEEKAKQAEEARKANEQMINQATGGQFKNFTRAQILEYAQLFHKRRKMSAQILDEAVDHKKRLTPTPENLIRWMKDPGKYDLIGIDTYEKNNPTADLKIKKEIFWHRLLKK